MQKNKRRVYVILVLMTCMIGCAQRVDNSPKEPENTTEPVNTVEEVSDNDAVEDSEILSDKETNDTVMDEAENTESSNAASDLIDAFIRGEINAESTYEGREPVNISELENNEEEWLRYEVGDRLDVDNDGEDELVMNGPYGGMILDARDDKVYILAEGDGMAAVLSVAKLDDEFWVVHADTSHGGREMYFLEKYNGKGEVTDTTTLSAEYWDNPDDQYDENSDFKFRDEPITMEEFERIRDEMYMWMNFDFEPE